MSWRRPQRGSNSSSSLRFAAVCGGKCFRKDDVKKNWADRYFWERSPWGSVKRSLLWCDLGYRGGDKWSPSPPGTAIHGKTSLRFFSVTKRETSAWASRREAAGYLRSSSCVDTDLRLEVVLVVMVDEERRDATRHVRSPPSRVLQVPSPLDVTAKLESWDSSQVLMRHTDTSRMCCSHLSSPASTTVLEFIWKPDRRHRLSWMQIL